jgi:ribosomal-protein-alanine N-acetyltransferase
MMAGDETVRSLISIEPMSPEDLSSVVLLERECGLNSRGMEGYRRALADPNALLLVAVIKDRGSNSRDIVGLLSAALILDEMHIDNIAVSRSFRRQGIASRMLIDGLDAARSRGALNAVLEVRSANSMARALYDRHKFIISGIRRSYYQSPPDDALIMSRRLESIENSPIKKVDVASKPDKRE